MEKFFTKFPTIGYQNGQPSNSNAQKPMKMQDMANFVRKIGIEKIAFHLK
jgi:hypothetical protein